eukprot:CAMPEP_0202868732 /NCGR_PEP_ID=MMETSP1391-20130828/11040_1 /ASSEMBLY_ACC=CAM_ASM_000867 /TAXON_ID=1034604 /ORGANISM="Chlamydomonas leiostraca, Strain SAG 11-49" /LENGTH=45 /DNA_ID= /DNA_START= /DNA_END= /DNA_ORIENTATION=
MIYDVTSMLFRSFLAVSGGVHMGSKSKPRQAPGESKKDNKPAMIE